MNSNNFINKLLNIGTRKSDDLKQYEKISYSQSGEDIIIEYLFGLRNITKPSCLDIGAYHPVVANNTYKFFLRGSKVVNIDANPSAIEKFNILRPADTNLNIGIGNETGEFDFYIMEDDALNTFSREEKFNLEKMGSRLKEVKRIQMIPVNNVLNEYFNSDAPDLISIDAEGVDFDIIKSFDFDRYTPKVICIETINYTPDGTGTKRILLCQFIEELGYFEYANTNINSIYVNKEWWYAGKEVM
ncbi:MAG: FkbM family methyltransferase [Ferruginibacter sp.]